MGSQVLYDTSIVLVWLDLFKIEAFEIVLILYGGACGTLKFFHECTEKHLIMFSYYIKFANQMGLALSSLNDEIQFFADFPKLSPQICLHFSRFFLGFRPSVVCPFSLADFQSCAIRTSGEGGKKILKKKIPRSTWKNVSPISLQMSSPDRLKKERGGKAKTD